MADTHRLPPPVTDVWDWQLHGACREMDSALFFHPENERGPARAGREAHAKQICRSCPVIQQCRAHSLAVREPYGVWGGMSESERNDIIRAQDRALRVGGAQQMTLTSLSTSANTRWTTDADTRESATSRKLPHRQGSGCRVQLPRR